MTTQALVPVPGLTQTIVVPTNAFVYLSTDGGIATNSATVNEGSIVDIVIGSDGLEIQNASVRRLTASNATNVAGLTQWSTAQVLDLAPGTHVITVLTRLIAGPAATVSGDTNSALQGQLTILIINR